MDISAFTFCCQIPRSSDAMLKSNPSTKPTPPSGARQLFQIVQSLIAQLVCGSFGPAPHGPNVVIASRHFIAERFHSMKRRLALAKTSSPLPTRSGPKGLLTDLREMILNARQSVATTVNATLTTLHWQIGRRIREDILKQRRAGYGEEIVATLSQQLEAEFGRGLPLLPGPSFTFKDRARGGLHLRRRQSSAPMHFSSRPKWGASGTGGRR